MVRRGILAGSAALWLVACGIAPTAEEQVPDGLDQAALLASSCSGCHAQGGSLDGIASLEGMNSQALRAKLLGYRNDPDGGSAMHRMARGYSEQQIELIARTLGSDPR